MILQFLEIFGIAMTLSMFFRFGQLDEMNVGWFDKVNPLDEYHRILKIKKLHCGD